MERRRHGWFAGFLVASSVLLTAAQCPRLNPSSADELVKLAPSADEAVTRGLLAKQADLLGAHEEDVAKSWISRFKSAPATYQGIDPQARDVGCDAVTSWAGAWATPDTSDDQTGMFHVAKAITNINASSRNASLRSDLAKALKEAQGGKMIYLDVLFLQTAICQAAAA